MDLRERHHLLPPTCAQTRHRTLNLGLCPDLQPFGARVTLQPAESPCGAVRGISHVVKHALRT